MADAHVWQKKQSAPQQRVQIISYIHIIMYTTIDKISINMLLL